MSIPAISLMNQLLLAHSARDNANLPRGLAKAIKEKTDIVPKYSPSQAADYAAILQELHYLIERGLGEIIEGTRKVFLPLTEFVEKVPWLSKTTLQRRLAKLKEIGLIHFEQNKKERFNRKNWYALDYEKIAELEDEGSLEIAPLPISHLDETSIDHADRDNDCPSKQERDHNIPLHSIPQPISRCEEKQKKENKEMFPETVDPNDPELTGRRLHPNKQTYSSRAADPWMETSQKPKADFIKWLQEDEKKLGREKSLRDLKAEIRNNYIRAQDSWEDYLACRGDYLTKEIQDAPAYDLNYDYYWLEHEVMSNYHNKSWQPSEAVNPNRRNHFFNTYFKDNPERLEYFLGKEKARRSYS